MKEVWKNIEKLGNRIGIARLFLRWIFRCGVGRSVHVLAAIAKAADGLVDFTHDMQPQPLADMMAVGTHEEFLNDLTVHFLDGKRKPKELRLHEVAPLAAKFRAEIGDCKTASPDIFRYGICTKRCDMAPTLRNFNRLGDLQLVCAPLPNERWIVSAAGCATG